MGEQSQEPLNQQQQQQEAQGGNQCEDTEEGPKRYVSYWEIAEPPPPPTNFKERIEYYKFHIQRALYIMYDEIAWRIADVINAHRAHVPDDQAPEFMRRLPPLTLNRLKTAFSAAMKLWYFEKQEELRKVGRLIFSARRRLSKSEIEELKQSQSSESAAVPLETAGNVQVQTKQQESVPVRDFATPYHDISNNLMKRMANAYHEITRDNFDLIRFALKQFVIGYNEGMGRDVSKLKAELIQSRQRLKSKEFTFSMDQWLGTVSKIAVKLRDFRFEVGNLSKVDDIELMDKPLSTAQNQSKHHEQQQQQQQQQQQPQQQQPQQQQQQQQPSSTSNTNNS